MDDPAISDPAVSTVSIGFNRSMSLGKHRLFERLQFGARWEMQAIFTVQFHFQAVDSPIHLDGQPLGAAKPSENWRKKRIGGVRLFHRQSDTQLGGRWRTPTTSAMLISGCGRARRQFFDKCPAPLQSDRGSMTVFLFLNKPASSQTETEHNRTEPQCIKVSVSVSIPLPP